MSRIRIDGTSAGETINGTVSDEEIRGLGGNDKLNGRGGDDLLRGGNGNDVLNGGDGNDRLRGDHGDDTLTGGPGHDRFIFNLEGGADTVKDYTDGQDRLDFTNFGLTDFNALLQHAEQIGSNVFFQMDGGETTTLQNVLLLNLDSGDVLI